MDIHYTDNSESINWTEVSNLFKAVKWGDRQPSIVESAFKKSSYVRYAYVNGKIVGVGRTVDDGAFYAWIVDLAVLPEHQGKGIGSHILKAVSYTHLRAHETREDLVCRLLLEKKN